MKIYINGTPREWAKETADYFDIVREVQRYGEPSMGWTVTYYWQGKGDSERKGTITLHKAPIKVADGMIFNAVITGNA